MKEHWVNIPDFDIYQISNFGRVRSFSKWSKGKIVKLDITRSTKTSTKYNVLDTKITGKRVRLKIHLLVYKLFIGNIPRGYVVDHKDRNGCNNKISNLRLATRKENARNCKKPSHGKTSIYKGVSFCKDKRKWYACLSLNNKTLSLGRYFTEKEAAIAYNKGAKKYFGKFARLNEVF